MGYYYYTGRDKEGKIIPSTRNGLKGDSKELVEQVTKGIEGYETNAHYGRAHYFGRYLEAEKKIRAVADNNRKKNKTVSYELLMEMKKCYFNYRAIDLYLYRLGYEADCGYTTDAGILAKMEELGRDLNNLMHMTDTYRGFNMVHWSYGGCEAFRGNGCIEEDKYKFLADYLGILYY